MKYWRLSGIRLDLSDKEDVLAAKTADLLKIKPSDIVEMQIVRKSIDARRHRAPQFVYVLKIVLAEDIQPPKQLMGNIHLEEMPHEPAMPSFASIRASQKPVVVVGAGPAGMFAAYELLSNKVPVILLERGRAIEKRVKDVEKFWNGQGLNPQSNVLFGEGGAGTFSDGKLTSRTKNPLAVRVKKIFVDMGARPETLVDAKPHIGTDSLRKIIVNFRKKLIEMGCHVEFDACVTDFIIQRDEIAAVIVNDREEIQTRQVILAIGQSAEDTYRALFAKGLMMKAKPFAMGLRAEHPQDLINEIQYGKWRGHPKLPPAEYFLTASLSDLNRSVYSFCMCPGGAVIGCSTRDGYLCVNGMSNARRSGKFANAALVVNVRVEDFSSDSNPLRGLDFRSVWEGKAYLAGGGNFLAPAQKITDFLKGKASDTLGETSYRPGVTPTLLHHLLPDFAAEAIKRGLWEFDKKMRGFITEEAHLIGVETRTSAPVRICRGKDGQSETVIGIYPCGEGAGYAGGIVSSAIDGIRTAQKLMESLR
ncbi:MAG TPA: NAD(P)/FAD-dependent oxidoreductase [Smithella sp.]|nr:NAD(P)/FAD-dependent oxidoreductase [Smithella sp.]